MISVKKKSEYNQLLDTKVLKNSIRLALKYLVRPTTTDITLVFTGDEQIRSLNLQYRQKDAPTDVLSFYSGEINPENGHLYLGDIIISIPRAILQSQKSEHPVNSEITLLCIHGLLHLLGYDHAEPDEKIKMWSVQKEILDQIGCQINKLPDD